MGLLRQCVVLKEVLLQQQFLACVPQSSGIQVLPLRALQEIDN